MPLAAGMSEREVTDMLNEEMAARYPGEGVSISRRQVRRRLDYLRGEIERGERRCVVCGEKIPPGSRSHKRTCSGRCRVALSRANGSRQKK